MSKYTPIPQSDTPWKIKRLPPTGDFGFGYSIIHPDGTERARFADPDIMATYYAQMIEYCDRLNEIIHVLKQKKHRKKKDGPNAAAQ